MQRLLDELDYVGVLALELFVAGDRLLANEFAPRVHNSGHWSIEGATPSQFTAHLLAICDKELPKPELHGHAGMLNLIGSIPDAARSLQCRCSARLWQDGQTRPKTGPHHGYRRHCSRPGQIANRMSRKL